MKNVSELVRNFSVKYPDKKAVVNPINNSTGYEAYSFSELETRINQFANRFTNLGVEPGHKVLFFVKPNLDFCAITFALFRMGAISVFIDPGMPRKNFFKCIEELNPDVLVGIPKVHYLAHLFPRSFKNISIFITTGKRNGLIRAKSIYLNLENMREKFDIFSPKSTDLAAILFTSGGTGQAKGVEYTHDIFIGQTEMLQKEFNLTHEDIDIPGFPLFSFFTLAMGMTTCIPDMDASKPANCDPAILYKNIIDNKASFVAGSPAIWERLAYYCRDNKLTIPYVKYLVMFGAPVRSEIHQIFKEALEVGTTYTPYGATECLPIANISGKFILENTSELSDMGHGICVGNLLEGVEVKIINPSNEPLKYLSDTEEVSEGSIGEIIVTSPNVTKAYYNNIQKTKESKILDGDITWHRMGDMGYMKNGQLWFCGRQKHIVTIDGVATYPVNVEAIFNKLPVVKRSALVEHRKLKKSALVIQTYPGNKVSQKEIIEKLKSCASEHELTKNIELFYFKEKLPVDIRHNIKIDRTSLEVEISELS
jgi:acyl-CoA synthetase (AMP-forming)/AMP-acid ligase II